MTEPSILHVDLDAFYASVEQTDDPSLAGRPVIVGGLGPRGVVAAASYEARPYGIHSAVPMGRARRLAPPEAVFRTPRFERYHERSEQVMTILRSVTPLVEPIASDEAFLDVAGARRSQGRPVEIAEALRARIHAETRLTASVGVATTKFLAKLASDLAKPNGMLVVAPGSELDFLHPLEVGRLWGVGPATRAKLERLGIRTVGELAHLDEGTLAAALGPAHAAHLHALAHNDDPRPVEPERDVKSVGHEETFPTDLTERLQLERELVRLADRVAARLRRAERAGRTVQLKLRYGDFRTITRSHTRGEPTDLAGDIAQEARALLDSVDLGEGVRLLGVSVQQLVPAEIQIELPLDGDADGVRAVEPDPRAVLERTVDAVRDRFGSGAVGPVAIPRDHITDNEQLPVRRNKPDDTTHARDGER